MTFFVRYKRNCVSSFQRTKNVGEGGVGVKRTGRPNPEPPKGGEAFTVCYTKFFYPPP